MVMIKETTNSGTFVDGAIINGLPSHRPSNFIVGVVDIEQEMARAVRDLNLSGFTQDSVFVLSGKQGSKTIRHRGEQSGTHGILKWISNRLDEFVGGELDSIQRHAQAVEQGSYVIGVQLSAGNGQQRQVAHDLLKRHGGYDIVLVERNFVSSLDA
jgi:hypothetical protein